MVELKDHLTQVDLTYKTCADSRALEGRLTALLDRCGQEHGSSSVPYASLLGELGGFYRGQGRFDEAEARFRQALALLETDPGRDSPEYATTLNNLAGVHRLQGRQKEALALQEGAADILAGLPQARGKLAASLCNQGALCQQMGDLAGAGMRLGRAISMFREELGTDTPHYHAVLNALGAVYFTAGRFQAARDCFEQAAQAAVELYGPGHYEVRAALDHRALAQSRLEERQ